jgi:hypothetical protein
MNHDANEGAYIPGLTLCERFYHEAIQPVLASEFAGLVYSAALIGPGSEVLGFDTLRSTDHHFGPRAILFLTPEDMAEKHTAIDQALRQGLPRQFMGYSTNFSAPDPADHGVRHAVWAERGPVNHMIEFHTLREYFAHELGVDPTGELSVVDWLTIEEQKLRSLTAGRVFFDGLGQLDALRQKLSFYPQEIWRYLLAAEWQKIAQEEAFVGRAGEVGDEIGSRLVTGRIVQELMRLCFLMERQYAPYSKWFGTGFSRLACSAELSPTLEAALAGANWHEREEGLCRAYALVARMHNRLGITAPVPTEASLYFGRPFRVIHADHIAGLIAETITDDQVRRLPAFVGSVNQFVGSVDVVDRIELCQKLRAVYD